MYILHVRTIAGIQFLRRNGILQAFRNEREHRNTPLHLLHTSVSLLLAVINRAGGLCGRILTKGVNAVVPSPSETQPYNNYMQVWGEGSTQNTVSDTDSHLK